MSIIEVSNLTKIFRLKQKQAGFMGGIKSIFAPQYQNITAVEQINFSVEAGEILAFIGPNGAGKSTTIKMLTGILYPSGGNLQVLGFDPSRQRQSLAYHIGSVFGQKSQLWFHLPPQDTFDLLARIYELDWKTYRQRLSYLIETFEIKPLLTTPVRKLSLGQRMRCEIVASFLHQPKIIFLDEPTIGLDIIAKQKIREIIKYVNKEEKTTIFLTSHDAGDIEELAQRTIVINHGQKIFDDTTTKLKQNYLTYKIIELITNQPIKTFDFPEGKITHQKDFSVRIELDTSKHSIDKLLNYAVKNFNLKDINIYDPPMEAIIASIYQDPSLSK